MDELGNISCQQDDGKEKSKRDVQRIATSQRMVLMGGALFTHISKYILSAMSLLSLRLTLAMIMKLLDLLEEGVLQKQED